MKERFLQIALGKSHYSTLFLVCYMVIAPLAFFTDSILLEYLAWFMTIVLGLFIFITGWVTLKHAKQSHQWPLAQGKWLSGSLTQRSSNGSFRYITNIHIKFQVAGKEYKGTQYDFSDSYESKNTAQKKLDEIKNMHPLWIRYNPNDPADNVIHPGVHFVHSIRLIIGTLAMIVPVLIMLDYIRFS
jgi:hypothetical protein